MKVWMFKCEFAYDGNEECVIRLFTTKKRAIEEFEKSKQEFYTDDHLAESESCVIEDDVPLRFTAYEDGNYCYDHLDLSVEEITVED